MQGLSPALVTVGPATSMMPTSSLSTKSIQPHSNNISPENFSVMIVPADSSTAPAIQVTRPPGALTPATLFRIPTTCNVFSWCTSDHIHRGAAPCCDLPPLSSSSGAQAEAQTWGAAAFGGPGGACGASGCAADCGGGQEAVSRQKTRVASCCP